MPLNGKITDIERPNRFRMPRQGGCGERLLLRFPLIDNKQDLNATMFRFGTNRSTFHSFQSTHRIQQHADA